MDRSSATRAVIALMAMLQLVTLGVLVDVAADFRDYKAATHSGRDHQFTVGATTHLADLEPAAARSPERRRLSSAIHSVSTVTAAETLTSTSSTVIFCDTSGSAITVTLPTASDMSENSGLAMRRFIIVNIGAAGSDCTVSTTASIYATGLTITNAATSTGVITNSATSTGVITNTVTASGTFTDASSTTTVYGGASAAATTTDTTTDAVTTVDGTIGVTTDVTSSISITPSVSSSIVITPDVQSSIVITPDVTSTIDITPDVTSTIAITPDVTSTIAITTDVTTDVTGTIANDASSTAATSIALTDASSISLITDGTNWYRIGGTTIATS